MFLVEPEPQMVSSSRVQWLDRHLARVCLVSELSPTQFPNAEEK
jgi:hypothetical protein